MAGGGVKRDRKGRKCAAGKEICRYLFSPSRKGGGGVIRAAKARGKKIEQLRPYQSSPTGEEGGRRRKREGRSLLLGLWMGERKEGSSAPEVGKD